MISRGSWGTLTSTGEYHRESEKKRSNGVTLTDQQLPNIQRLRRAAQHRVVNTSNRQSHTPHSSPGDHSRSRTYRTSRITPNRRATNEPHRMPHAPTCVPHRPRRHPAGTRNIAHAQGARRPLSIRHTRRRRLRSSSAPRGSHSSRAAHSPRGSSRHRGCCAATGLQT